MIYRIKKLFIYSLIISRNNFFFNGSVVKLLYNCNITQGFSNSNDNPVQLSPLN